MHVEGGSYQWLGDQSVELNDERIIAAEVGSRHGVLEKESQPRTVADARQFHSPSRIASGYEP